MQRFRPCDARRRRARGRGCHRPRAPARMCAPSRPRPPRRATQQPPERLRVSDQNGVQSQPLASHKQRGFAACFLRYADHWRRTSGSRQQRNDSWQPDRRRVGKRRTCATSPCGDTSDALASTGHDRARPGGALAAAARCERVQQPPAALGGRLLAAQAGRGCWVAPSRVAHLAG